MLRQELESAKLQNEWQARDLAICAEKQREGEAENEALRQELESLKEGQKARSFWLHQASKRIDEFKAENEALKAELAELRSQNETLQENSEIDFDFAGKAGELVSWLRKTVGKALPKQVTVKEVQKILEGGDN